MKLEGEQVLLRVFMRSTDQCGWGSAVSQLLERARLQRLAGATVLEGVFGFDLNGELLDRAPWSLVERLPVVVEFVDGSAAIAAFLPMVAETVSECTATLERACVLLYRESRESAARSIARLDLPGAVADLSTIPKAEDHPVMKQSEEGRLLRVFIGESDSWEGAPLYRAIVMRARELGLAGATVLRGGMGFGAHSRVHTSKLLELSTDLPIVVEIVDVDDKIKLLLPFLDEAVGEGLVTIEAVQVTRYRRGAESK